MDGSVEEQHAEHKIEYDQQDQDTVHYQVDPYIGFILPVKLLQPPEHSAQFLRKLTFFCLATVIPPITSIVEMSAYCGPKVNMKIMLNVPSVTDRQTGFSKPARKKLFLTIGATTPAGCPDAYNNHNCIL